jgi:hypothetical protein
MKNIPIILILCTTLLAHAYEFSFYNNTNNPIGIAIQFTGNDSNEPLYTQLVKPKSMVTFTPGKTDIPEIKWGFCLDQIYYVENPTSEEKMHHFAKAPWRKVAVTWVKERSKTKKTPKVSTNKPTTEKSAPATLSEKSLCRDRHFDIIYDEQQKVAITSSLVE